MTDLLRMKLPSDETRPAVDKVRQMLVLGIDIQATGGATNSIVAGVIDTLLSHIDELEADLNTAVAVGRMAAGALKPLLHAHEEEAVVAWHCIYRAYGHFTLKKSEADQAKTDGAEVRPLAYASTLEKPFMHVQNDQVTISLDHYAALLRDHQKLTEMQALDIEECGNHSAGSPPR